jgi:LysM repeat protein
MTFRNQLLFCALVFWLAVTLSSCEPGQSSLDEEKEPHYVLGQNRVNAMDYQGAVEAFEESLEVNPHSAAAHFELAWLYDEKISDPAAAIYHYQEYLKLDPNAENADVIKKRIYSCKQQLAADVLPLPSTPAEQQQLQQLADENRRLTEQVALYKSQLALLESNPPPNPAVQMASTQTQNINAERPANPAPPRTHTVAAGETESAIARRFGVKLSALEAANPGVNPNRLRVGQILNLPPP